MPGSMHYYNPVTHGLSKPPNAANTLVYLSAEVGQHKKQLTASAGPHRQCSRGELP